ncbi:MAG: hypothetical protein Q7T86_18305 [Hyphomicrobiaceae bacterium]|nr:hypothetical protein [Hyphomicrobiaceae bacterium]
MTTDTNSRLAAHGRREFSSFRDPSGYLFWEHGQIYRRVLAPYAKQYDAATSAGLFARAISDGRLLPFEELPGRREAETTAILRPAQLTFVSYPYEWSFDQLKDAALVTLDLHLQALEHEMLLKDASAYNIQFVGGRPQLIDHLSFDFLSEYGAWPAYGQFCRHFLAPLALMAYVDLSLGKLSQLYLDGVPLELAASLLPRRTKLRPGIYLHLHLHAKMQKAHGGTRKKVSGRKLSAPQLKAIASSLRSLVASLKPRNQETEWGSYYEETNYTGTAFGAKRNIVREMMSAAQPKTMWDVGGNNGEFSRAVADLVPNIVCMDIDPAAVIANYNICKRTGVANILPLVVDLTNPSPAIGFANEERAALQGRSRPDAILALALVHHLAISNNLPLEYIAAHFADLAETLVIEFVEKSDSQVQRLLLNRKDIFPHYTEAGFEAAFGTRYEIEQKQPIPGAARTLYLMRRK